MLQVDTDDMVQTLLRIQKGIAALHGGQIAVLYCGLPLFQVQDIQVLDKAINRIMER